VSRRTRLPNFVQKTRSRDAAAARGWKPIADLIAGQLPHDRHTDDLSPGDPYVERQIEPPPLVPIRPEPSED